MSTDITTTTDIIEHAPAVPAFNSASNFDLIQRMAKAMAASSLVPVAFQGEKGIANCIVALELAQRTGASPLMVAQNLHVIQGRPSWSSAFIIGAINASGKFTPLRFVIEGEGDSLACHAVARDKATDEDLVGPLVTMAMAKAEGWLSKQGSKWQTMPTLMIRYRAAAFWGRLYCPELLMGLATVEESGEVTSVRGVLGLKERLARQAGGA
jgi:hypothetical protein